LLVEKIASDRNRPVTMVPGRRAGWCCQPGGEGAQRATAAVTVAAQGQRRSSRSWVRRPDRVRRPAMASSRRRSVLGSATRSGPDNGVRVQVSRVVGDENDGQPDRVRCRVVGDENDGQPDRVRCRVVERQVGQANVFGAADAVFGAAATVEEIAAVSVGQSPAAGVGGKQVIRRPSWSTGRSCAPGAALRGR
jgi:hypothetical protein